MVHDFAPATVEKPRASTLSDSLTRDFNALEVSDELALHRTNARQVGAKFFLDFALKPEIIAKTFCCCYCCSVKVWVENGQEKDFSTRYIRDRLRLRGGENGSGSADLKDDHGAPQTVIIRKKCPSNVRSPIDFYDKNACRACF